MILCVVGVGLIGSSLILALKDKRNDIEAWGVGSPKGATGRALAMGIIEKQVSFEEGVSQADLIILATPVDIILQQLPQALDLIKDNAYVVDLGSAKSVFSNAIDNHPKRKQYISAHPIAGTENSGPEAAFKELYKGKNMIICDKDLSDTKGIELWLTICKNLEMNICYMQSEEHDKHLAYVSHLSHISSFALGATVLDEEKNDAAIFSMAGSGFSSTVRLAKSSASMWKPIFSQNKENISEALGAYIEKLEKFKQAIDEEDDDQLMRIMNKANDIRRILKD